MDAISCCLCKGSFIHYYDETLIHCTLLIIRAIDRRRWRSWWQGWKNRKRVVHTISANLVWGGESHNYVWCNSQQKVMMYCGECMDGEDHRLPYVTVEKWRCLAEKFMHGGECWVAVKYGRDSSEEHGNKARQWWGRPKKRWVDSMICGWMDKLGTMATKQDNGDGRPNQLCDYRGMMRTKKRDE